MIEFNNDGSIRLPGNILDEKRKKDYRMASTRCARIRKEVVSSYAPKKCILHVTLSDAIKDGQYMESAFNRLKAGFETPVKLIPGVEKEYHFEIGTNFKRCSECNKILAMITEMFDGNIILDKGSCTLKEREFCYEDHFD
jgi:hypothetical protein